MNKFISFLEETLIPDLKESGRVHDAKNLEQAIKFMKGAKIVEGISKNKFLAYIESGEKSLRLDGFDCTADDYFTARQFIYWMDT